MTRKQITAHAKAAVMRSDIQQQLAERVGGFVWHVEKWPNWLQISVDQLGNDSDDHRATEKTADSWFCRHEEEVKQMFADLLGDQFGEIAILSRSMGTGPQQGSCCRTGCGGCMNGVHNKLLTRLTGDPVEPAGDRLG